MLLFQFSPVILSRVSFIYSISFNNLKYGFENSENYFQIRQQQGTSNLKEGDIRFKHSFCTEKLRVGLSHGLGKINYTFISLGVLELHVEIS